jgi:hypothetical protein
MNEPGVSERHWTPVASESATGQKSTCVMRRP